MAMMQNHGGGWKSLCTGKLTVFTAILNPCFSCSPSHASRIFNHTFLPVIHALFVRSCLHVGNQTWNTCEETRHKQKAPDVSKLVKGLVQPIGQHSSKCTVYFTCKYSVIAMDFCYLIPRKEASFVVLLLRLWLLAIAVMNIIWCVPV